MGFFDKIKQGLTKTKTKMDAQLTGIFAAYEPGDEEFFEDLEETLILADTGLETTTKAIAQLRKAIELKKLRTGAEVKKEFVQILTRILKVQDTMLLLTTQPSVVLVVGVNGVGKTTTIGKLAKYYKQQGKSVMLAAGDTFRAAASEQLTIWADRVGVPIVKHQEGADAAAVVFDATASAKAKGMDILLVDTAGRLQTKSNLMEELRKMARQPQYRRSSAGNAPRPRCHDGPECRQPGQTLRRRRPLDGRRPDQARRDGQRWRHLVGQAGIGRPRPLGRRRRRRRRPASLRCRPVRRCPVR